MALSKEELLKPRYKVIAGYPGCDFSMGGIIVLDKINEDERVGKDVYYCYHAAFGLLAEFDLSPYPHLFRKLEWHQDRKPEELLGGYAKSKRMGYVTKINEPISADGEWFVWDNLKNSVPFTDYDPATLEEYNQFINPTVR